MYGKILNYDTSVVQDFTTVDFRMQQFFWVSYGPVWMIEYLTFIIIHS